jgi:hypothetical protein
MPERSWEEGYAKEDPNAARPVPAIDTAIVPPAPRRERFAAGRQDEIILV